MRVIDRFVELILKSSSLSLSSNISGWSNISYSVIIPCWFISATSFQEILKAVEDRTLTETFSGDPVGTRRRKMWSYTYIHTYKLKTFDTCFNSSNCQAFTWWAFSYFIESNDREGVSDSRMETSDVDPLHWAVHSHLQSIEEEWSGVGDSVTKDRGIVVMRLHPLKEYSCCCYENNSHILWLFRSIYSLK